MSGTAGTDSECQAQHRQQGFWGQYDAAATCACQAYACMWRVACSGLLSTAPARCRLAGTLDQWGAVPTLLPQDLLPVHLLLSQMLHCRLWGNPEADVTTEDQG